jgi:Concanavalin A-like lectin/glucanases superfamily/Bacterial Ig domain
MKKKMKTVKSFFVGLLVLGIVGACNEGIDPISSVDPGPDQSAPVVNISYPGEGTLIRVTEAVTSISIEFEAIDDIELQSITLLLDGAQIGNLASFKDYRRVLESYSYDALTNGPHTLTITAKDVSSKTTSKTVNFEKVAPYQPLYEGEIFYMPFDGDYLELVSITNPAKVGSPVFADGGVAGKAYQGAADAYLTFPTTGLLGSEFSAAFWYKLNASPDRSGVLTIGPPDPAFPATPNNRKNGFRFFREGSPTNQTFKLNVGNGEGDSWFDGGAAASIDPTTNTDWVHMAFTISASGVKVYINGVVVSQGTLPPGTTVDWTGCDVLSIASGAPRFMEWGHLSDQSLFDELRLFNKALSQAEVQAVMDGD